MHLSELAGVRTCGSTPEYSQCSSDADWCQCPQARLSHRLSQSSGQYLRHILSWSTLTQARGGDKNVQMLSHHSHTHHTLHSNHIFTPFAHTPHTAFQSYLHTIRTHTTHCIPIISSHHSHTPHTAFQSYHHTIRTHTTHCIPIISSHHSHTPHTAFQSYHNFLSLSTSTIFVLKNDTSTRIAQVSNRSKNIFFST